MIKAVVWDFDFETPSKHYTLILVCTYRWSCQARKSMFVPSVWFCQFPYDWNASVSKCPYEEQMAQPLFPLLVQAHYQLSTRRAMSKNNEHFC